jgi:hypothetical protein
MYIKSNMGTDIVFNMCTVIMSGMGYFELSTMFTYTTMVGMGYFELFIKRPTSVAL